MGGERMAEDRRKSHKGRSGNLKGGIRNIKGKRFLSNFFLYLTVGVEGRRAIRFGKLQKASKRRRH